MAATALLRQAMFRFRNDDGDEVGATWARATNEQPVSAVQPGTLFRIRFVIEEYAGKNARDSAFALIMRVNGGSWVGVDATSPFKFELSDHIVGADPTTQQLSSGTFVSGYLVEDGGTPGTITIVSNGSTEYELMLSLNLDGYGVTYNDGDTIELGMAFSDMALLDDYIQMPTFTVAALTQFSKIHVGGQKINEFRLGGALVPRIYLGDQEVYRNE